MDIAATAARLGMTPEQVAGVLASLDGGTTTTRTLHSAADLAQAGASYSAQDAAELERAWRARLAR